MKTAFTFADLSYAVRARVGCIIVKDDNIISHGWNGMPPGEDNCCEDILPDGSLKTKPECIHAEDNALRKLTRSNESAAGAIVFNTLAPCLPCSARLVDARVSTVYYCHEYLTSQPGLDYLRRKGVVVEQLVLE